MPSLYGNTSTSYTVTASNVISLYQVSTSTAVITATTYSTNLVGLYGGSYSALPTNAEQLIQLFDNSGNVQFYLDPATNSSTIYAVVYNINTSTALIGNYNFTGNTITNTVNANIDLGTNGNNWYYNSNGTMSFPNNVIDVGTQPIDLKSSYYSELWWQNPNTPTAGQGKNTFIWSWENQAGIVVDSVDYGYLEWDFNSDGTLKLPSSALLGDLNNDNGVVLRAYLGATTLSSYDENQNVIADDGAVYIQTLYATTSSHQWAFAQDGKTQFPNYVFPYAHGLAGQVLADDGSGTLAWTTATGGGGSGVTSITAGTGTYVSTSTGAVTIWTTPAPTVSTAFDFGTILAPVSYTLDMGPII